MEIDAMKSTYAQARARAAQRARTPQRLRTSEASATAAPLRLATIGLMQIVTGFAVLATLGLIVAGAALRGGDGATRVAVAGGVVTGDHSKGPAGAPVTIVEYTDLQCPACASFSETVERQIEAAYVATGIVRIEYRHFPFLGKESQRAAEAAECAREQGQFFAFRDTLYTNQKGENRGAFSDDHLKAFAAGLGLDTRAFNACLDSGRSADQVKAQKAEGERLGVRATPTVFINGRKLEGLTPFATFKQLIERAAGRGS
jgi:protein-disulfide isomerase